MLRLILKLHHTVLAPDAPRERATGSLEKKSPAGCLWWQFHITKRGLREILFTLRLGVRRSPNYKERLAIIASPIVAFADVFVDR